MRNITSAVVTAYGHGKTIDNIVVSLFEDFVSTDYWDKTVDKGNARTYCGAINRLELKDDNWVSARIVTPNQFYTPEDFLPPDLNNIFKELLLTLDDRAIQKVLREVETRDIIPALYRAEAELTERVYANMTKRAAQILKEDIECKGAIAFEETKTAREKIVAIIRHLEDVGDIVIGKTGEDELVV